MSKILCCLFVLASFTAFSESFAPDYLPHEGKFRSNGVTYKYQSVSNDGDSYYVTSSDGQERNNVTPKQEVYRKMVAAAELPTVHGRRYKTRFPVNEEGIFWQWETGNVLFYSYQGKGKFLVAKLTNAGKAPKRAYAENELVGDQGLYEMLVHYEHYDPDPEFIRVLDTTAAQAALTSSQLRLPARGVYKLRGLTYRFEKKNARSYHVLALGLDGQNPHPLDLPWDLDAASMFKELVAAGILEPEAAEDPDSIFDLELSGVFKLADTNYRYTSVGNGLYLLKARGKLTEVYDEEQIHKMLIASGAIKAPAPTPKTTVSSDDRSRIPSSGIYDRGSSHFESLGNGMYRIRAMSGDGRRPSAFDRGLVVNEAEMFKRLVESGFIRPRAASVSESMPASTGLSNSGRYSHHVRGQFSHDFHYQAIEGGKFLVRSMSGDGRNPNRFDNGTVMTAEELQSAVYQSQFIQDPAPCELRIRRVRW